MTRPFRPYGKKRGQRRTGSKQLGRVGEAIFFLFFVAVGGAGLAYMLTAFLWPEWKANRHFAERPAVVLRTRVASPWPEAGGGLGERAAGSTRQPAKEKYRAEVRLRYELGGATYEHWAGDVHGFYTRGRADKEALLQRFPPGATVRCWVDPEEPARVVIARGYTWWMWLLLVLPASFLILGGAGVTRAVLQSLTSTERHAALSQRAARLAPFEETTGRRAQFPSLPPEDTLTDSPGTRLTYRLPAQSAPQWTLTGMLLLCLFWNVIVLWIAAGIFRDGARGAGDSTTLLVVLPFAAVGVWLAWQFARRFHRMTGIGTTRVEISGHPLLPGQSYRMLLSQSGRRHIDRLDAMLVCEEQATYRQGTDARTARQTVYQVPIYRRDEITIRTAVPFEDQCDVQVPADAMHSFQSGHNEVKWELVVRAAVAGWPPSERRFPVVVYPGDPPSVAQRSAS